MPKTKPVEKKIEKKSAKPKSPSAPRDLPKGFDPDLPENKQREYR